MADPLAQSVVPLCRHALGSLKSQLVSHVLDFDPYFGLSGLSVQQKALMQHLKTDTGSSGPHWGKKEHTASVHIPLMTGAEVSRSLRIVTSTSNPVSHVQADGNENMSSVLTG